MTDDGNVRRGPWPPRDSPLTSAGTGEPPTPSPSDPAPGWRIGDYTAPGAWPPAYTLSSTHDHDPALQLVQAIGLLTEMHAALITSCRKCRRDRCKLHSDLSLAAMDLAGRASDGLAMSHDARLPLKPLADR